MNIQLIIFSGVLALTLAIPTNLDATVYDGCSTDYGCFGMPSGCVSAKACNILVTYYADNGVYKLDLHHYNTNGPTDNYYAGVGFSNNDKMADSVIYECVTSGQVKGVTAYAEKAERPKKQIIDAIDTDAVVSENGGLKCSFTAKPNVVGGKSTFNLDQPIYLLLAQGLVKNGEIEHHDKQAVSPQKVKLSDKSIIESTLLLLDDDTPKVNMNYDDCSKAGTICFGLPKDCVDKKACTSIVQATKIDGKAKFDVYRQAPVDQKNVNYYVAVGLSRDDKMPDSAVVECIRNGNKTKFVKAYAKVASLPEVQDLPNVDAKEPEVGETWMHCEITVGEMTSATGANNVTSEFKLTEELHLLLSQGNYDDKAGVILHHDSALASEKTYKLNFATSFQASVLLLVVAALFSANY